MDIKIKAKIDRNATSEDIFETILTSRGYKTSKAKEEFLHPKDISLEFLLKESGLKKSVLSKAQKIINTHLESNNDICVFGDYDADGVSATAVMWQAISAYGKMSKSKSRILPFMPDRHRHGYGLSDKAVGEVMEGSAFSGTSFKDFIPKLIITVDTGIVAIRGIKSFISKGIDVIVTDHHVPEFTLPEANCIVHSIMTSGAGIAWIFAMYLLGEPALKLLDLATIGIVGDMMPLTGLNRAICIEGLRALSHSKRPGLVSMKEQMGVSNKAITTYDISFGIAPRINAAGRIYNPLDALRLLCTSDQKLAKELAAKIEAHNKDRQEYTDRALKLSAGSCTDHKIIVIIGDYHEGVIGLVAGKLTEIFHRPSIVMSEGEEIVKGSARSVQGVNITKLLRSLKTPFIGLGGHDQAAGFSIAQKLVSKMQKELELLGDAKINEDLLVKHHSADMKISLASTSLKLAKLLTTLGPYGMGNQKPKFLINDLTVLEDRKLGAEGKHRKLTVEKDGVTRELMLFNTREVYPLQNIKSLICTIDINVWRDRESLQLIASYVEV